jgi:hypothetical protein
MRAGGIAGHFFRFFLTGWWQCLAGHGRTTAEVLSISEAAAAKRYVRALDSLQGALAGPPGGREGL